MMENKESSRAGTPRGCLPFVLASAIALAVVALGIFIVANQIALGPFDEEPLEEIYFITEYDAQLGKPDRVDDRGFQLIDILAILQRDRENYHVRKVRQIGDGDDLNPASQDSFFASRQKRADLMRAELSIPDAARTQMLARETQVRVLVQSRARDNRLLVAVSIPADEVVGR